MWEIEDHDIVWHHLSPSPRPECLQHPTLRIEIQVGVDSCSDNHLVDHHRSPGRSVGIIDSVGVMNWSKRNILVTNHPAYKTITVALNMYICLRIFIWFYKTISTNIRDNIAQIIIIYSLK